MIRRVSPAALTQLSRRREAFTLLEVLVVVAILVILASVAGISYFRYVEDARVDTSRQTMKTLEQACKNYMVKNGGQAPTQLTELVAPSDGSRPYIEGGLGAITDPWGKQYQYNGSNTNAQGDPDPVVFTTNPSTNQPIYALGR